MSCNHFEVIINFLTLTFCTKYQISIVDATMNFTWYRFGKEINGITHQEYECDRFV